RDPPPDEDRAGGAVGALPRGDRGGAGRRSGRLRAARRLAAARLTVDNDRAAGGTRADDRRDDVSHGGCGSSRSTTRSGMRCAERGLWADGGRLQQSAWNLLSNAIKLTPEGGGVESRGGLADGRAEIVVSDTGRGIRPDSLPFVFERFRQADSATTRTHGGLGI